MAETHLTVPDNDPQDAIASVLLELVDTEPTPEQIHFLNTEADKIEGGLIVHIDGPKDRLHRNQNRNPGQIYHPDNEVVKPLDPKVAIGRDILVRGALTPATPQGSTKFTLAHTYNYVNPDHGVSTRLDDTLAKALLKYSSYNLPLLLSDDPEKQTELHERYHNGNILPDSSKVHIDASSYDHIKQFVRGTDGITADFLQLKGFNRHESFAILGYLQKEKVVDTQYTTGVGHSVPPRKTEAELKAESDRSRRKGVFRRGIRGTIATITDPEVSKPAPYPAYELLKIDNTSLGAINPVDLSGLTVPEDGDKAYPEDYLIGEKYWDSIIQKVARAAGYARPDRPAPQMSAFTLSKELSGKHKIDSAQADLIAHDLQTMLIRDEVFQPLVQLDSRTGRPRIVAYQFVMSHDEILAKYGVEAKDEEDEDRPRRGREHASDGRSDTLEDWEEVAADPRYAKFFADTEGLEELHKAIQEEVWPLYEARLAKLNTQRAKDKKPLIPSVYKMPRDEKDKLVIPIDRRLSKEYMESDVPDDVLEALSVARLVLMRKLIRDKRQGRN